MLARPLRRWPNIKTTLGQPLRVLMTHMLPLYIPACFILEQNFEIVFFFNATFILQKNAIVDISLKINLKQM